MSLISHVAVDWQRYRIHDCRWPYPFPAELIGHHLWEVQRNALLAWTWDLGTIEIIVPVGYQFDGASIPGWACGIVDPITALIGALPHDILYETQAGWRTFRTWQPDGFSLENAIVDATTGMPLVFDGANPPDGERRRARADAVLRAFWIATRMPEDMADCGYAAVRIAGADAWDNVEPQALAICSASIDAL